MAPSGAFELEWNNGKRIGAGRVVRDMMTVASSTNDDTVIILMTINPDGSLYGQWSQRKDRGYQGTEIWKNM